MIKERHNKNKKQNNYGSDYECKNYLFIVLSMNQPLTLQFIVPIKNLDWQS